MTNREEKEKIKKRISKKTVIFFVIKKDFSRRDYAAKALRMT